MISAVSVITTVRKRLVINMHMEILVKKLAKIHYLPDSS